MGLATSPKTDPVSMWLAAVPHNWLIALMVGHLVGVVPQGSTKPLSHVAGLQSWRVALSLPHPLEKTG